MKSYLFRTFYFCAFLAGFFVLGNGAEAAIIRHDGEIIINQDTVWHDGDVHVISGENAGIVINYGARLTLEPGVIIKLDVNSVVFVVGKLSAIGTMEKPVVITSIKDDKYGGDTNGDGSVTAPKPGDWASIMIPVSVGGQAVDGEVILDYAIVSYGGRQYDSDFFTFVIGESSKFAVSNSELFNNVGLILLLPQAGNFSLNHSNVYAPDYCQEVEPGNNVCGGAIFSQNSSLFEVSGNYWGNPAGPSVAGANGITWGGVLLSGNYNYLPFSSEKFDLFKSAAVKRHPVILIPGILGSWPDMNVNKLILDPILHTYDDLWYALVAAGYTTGTNLFAFPYEWRQSNIISAQLLKARIAQVKTLCVSTDVMDCSKVDLVAHSMGGLVARQYIAFDDYVGDVDQLIFIATPHKGAPKAYAMWEGGYNGESFQDKFLLSILKYESKKVTGISGDIGLVAYLHDYNIDSVRELLPIYPYIYDEILGQVRYYPDNYPVNYFLENLNTPANLHKLKSAVKITNIIGSNGSNTITGYSVINSTKPLPMWENGMPRDFDSSKSGVLIGNGDDTVPAISNSNFLDFNPVVINQDHGRTVSYSQGEIIKELTGSLPTSEIHSSYSWKSYLLITLQCPADIQVIAPDGKRLGRDVVSSSTLAEISGGYYYYSNDSLMPEYAIIPNPLEGEYQVKVVGTDNGGAYTINTNYINDATSTEAEYAGVILPGQEQSLKFDFSSSSASVAEIKSNITIKTAIDDISLLSNQKLLTDKNAKKKLIQQYNLLKLKMEIADKLIDLAVRAVKKLEDNRSLKPAVKAKLIALANREIDKLRAKRQTELIDGLNDIDRYAQKLMAGKVLKQLGYDIIKSNNDYLINNW